MRKKHKKDTTTPHQYNRSMLQDVLSSYSPDTNRKTILFSSLTSIHNQSVRKTLTPSTPPPVTIQMAHQYISPHDCRIAHDAKRHQFVTPGATQWLSPNELLPHAKRLRELSGCWSTFRSFRNKICFHILILHTGTLLLAVYQYVGLEKGVWLKTISL